MKNANELKLDQTLSKLREIFKVEVITWNTWQGEVPGSDFVICQSNNKKFKTSLAQARKEFGGKNKRSRV